MDDLSLDGRRETAAAPVNLEESRNVALHPAAGVNDARAQFHFERQLIVAETTIAFEGAAVDDRVLQHAHDERAGLAPQADVGEQACFEQGLERTIDALAVERVADSDAAVLKVGAHRLRLDALISLDANFPDDPLRALRRDRAGREGHGRQHGEYADHPNEARQIALHQADRIYDNSPKRKSTTRMRTRSFHVTNTIRVKTTAIPIRKPNIWARWPSGLPRTASNA